MPTPTNGVEPAHKPGLLSPLDRAQQEAFVTTVREGARAGILLALGIVIGVAFTWLAGFRTKKK